VSTFSDEEQVVTNQLPSSQAKRSNSLSKARAVGAASRSSQDWEC